MGPDLRYFFFIINRVFWFNSDPDLYFPADTPVGHVNPKRHYNILKKRHIRQRERLIQLQIKELDEYHKNFSIEYKNDLIIKPTITATELVSGSDFLASSSHIITELLSTIPDQIFENQNKPAEKKARKGEEEEINANKREYSEILKVKEGGSVSTTSYPKTNLI